MVEFGISVASTSVAGTARRFRDAERPGAPRRPRCRRRLCPGVVRQPSQRTSGGDLIADLRHIRVVMTSACPAHCVDSGRLRQERCMGRRAVLGLEEVQLDSPRLTCRDGSWGGLASAWCSTCASELGKSAVRPVQPVRRNDDPVACRSLHRRIPLTRVLVRLTPPVDSLRGPARRYEGPSDAPTWASTWPEKLAVLWMRRAIEEEP